MLIYSVVLVSVYGKVNQLYNTYVVVQWLSHVQLFATPWTAASQASVFHCLWSLLKLMSIESEMPSNHLMLCPSPPALSLS